MLINLMMPLFVWSPFNSYQLPQLPQAIQTLIDSKNGEAFRSGSRNRGALLDAVYLQLIATDEMWV